MTDLFGYPVFSRAEQKSIERNEGCSTQLLSNEEREKVYSRLELFLRTEVLSKPELTNKLNCKKNDTPTIGRR